MGVVPANTSLAARITQAIRDGATESLQRLLEENTELASCRIHDTEQDHSARFFPDKDKEKDWDKDVYQWISMPKIAP